MTVSSTLTTLTFTGDGVTTTFPLGGLDYRDPTTLVVETRTPPAAFGAATGYTVTAAGVVFAVAPAAADEIRVTRRTPLTQGVAFPPAQPIDATRLNAALDRTTLQLQEIATDVARPAALRVPDPETVVALPAAAGRANGVLGFDSAGAPSIVPFQPEAPGAKEAYWWGGLATGSASAHALTLPGFPASPTGGERIIYLAPAANAGAVTLAVNGGTAFPLRKGNGTTALDAADFPVTAVAVEAVFDPTSGGRWRVITILPGALVGYAVLAATNTFLAAQLIQIATAAAGLTVRSTDATADPARFDLDRFSVTPAVADALFDLAYRGRDASAVAVDYAYLRGLIKATTNGAHVGEMQMLVAQAGVMTAALSVSNGVLIGNPTGGYKGPGSLNAQTLFLNGVSIGVPGRVFLETKVLGSAAATIPFTLPAAFKQFEFEFRLRRTAAAALIAEVSRDAGATWVSGGSDYVVAYIYTAGGPPSNFVSASAAMAIAAYNEIASGEFAVGDGKFFVGSASYKARWRGGPVSEAGGHTSLLGGIAAAAGLVDAIRFRASSGNLDTGSQVSLFGIVE